MIRIMEKNKWIDDKKYKVSMELLYEIGKILILFILNKFKIKKYNIKKYDRGENIFLN